MGISNKIRRDAEMASWIRRMFEEGQALKAKHGERAVHDFTLGNPILEPPARFKEALRELAERPVPGMHRYMSNAGYGETRAAVAEFLRSERALPFTKGHVVMSCGAAGGLNVVLKAILDPGDEVIIFTPYFAEYYFYIDNHGGVPRPVETTRDFLIDAEAVAAAIGPRTRAVIINSPNNPTGRIYPQPILRELCRVLEEGQRRTGREIYLISDEPYRLLVYDGAACADLFPLYERTILVVSHSKDIGLPGERIGYIAISPRVDEREATELFGGFTFVTRTLGFVNAPALMQRAITRILGATVDVAAYRRKRDRLYDHLKRIGFRVSKPEGAFYLFPESPLPDDIAFVREMQKEMILAVPGTGFGRAGYFRLSYSVEDETIERSLPAFTRIAERFRLKG